MILVTGGLGFIGSATVQALLDAGEQCVLVQRSHSEVPAGRFTAPVAVEQVDATDADALLSVGTRHKITGIIHLAGSMPWPPSPSEPPVQAAQRSLGSLFNIMRAAQEWGVPRVLLASTIGVYGAALAGDGPLTEDMPVSLSSPHLIPAFKKVSEVLSEHLANVTGVETVNLRISGTWGPLGHSPDPFFPAPQLVHAAARGEAPDLSGVGGRMSAEDALDLCYVKDTGRAIALLALADHLNHRTYNVASGRASSNAEVATAIRTVVPDAQVDLPAGGSTHRAWLDITRLREDTGYQPEWDLERAAADYIAWLRAGNPR